MLLLKMLDRYTFNNFMKLFRKKYSNKGFSIIELMVAMSIFMIVMVMSSGSILGVFNANQKSKTLRSVMDNLSSSMEGMTRTIRFGTVYHCGSGDTSTPLDCAVGDNIMTVTQPSSTKVTYSLSSGRIIRTILGVDNYITSSDVVITNLLFRVSGSAVYPDLQQPQVIIVIQGYVDAKTMTKSTFSLETTVSQRVFDFQ